MTINTKEIMACLCVSSDQKRKKRNNPLLWLSVCTRHHVINDSKKIPN